MSKKYFYFYLALGIIFLITGTISLINDDKLATGLGDLIPATLLLYMAYKTYKMKNDSEVM